ncbi:MAG: putative DNA polymerase [Prokaryotic dsDNA virus sp.]|nr:MAG: putative DNA polymerase [Prokaryotic dsDNA virus sp.]|tara:strand:- start:2091 stop:4406 length:2316 start_codon:yes stop_codon:yes gene_type:complete
MRVLTFDLEVQNHTLHKRKASPFDKRNYIVEAGWKVNNGPVQSKRWDEWHRESVMDEQFNSLEKGDVIVGFNIKFDLLWVWHQESLQNALKRGVRIFCCQYAEYLLGGQTKEVQMTSMNNVAEMYGGGCKIDAVKELWEEGYLTSEIPPDLLHDYLCGDGDEIVGDVENTYRIFRGQVKRMKEEHPKEFRTMINFRMDGLLATTEMEYNGVYCNGEVGEELRKGLVSEIERTTAELESFIPELPPELVFNWGSNVHKSCLIFGGVVKYQKWVAHTDENGNLIYAKKTIQQPLFNNEPVPKEECILAGQLYVREVPEGQGFEHKGKFYQTQDRYKSGKKAGLGKFKNVTVPDETKPKGAKKDHYFKFDGFVKPHHSWKSETTDAYDNPLYSTGAEVIKKLAQRGLKFTDALAKRTTLDKDLGTYYWKEDKKGKRKGMLCLIGDDGIIHHGLKHSSTVTSRMSSSDPNLQNIPRGDKSNVKKMFQSRFGDGGRVGEIDYSQLEVVVQGVLSGDENLRRDLNNRIDFHCKRLAAKLGEDYDEVKHKAKVLEVPEYTVARTNAKIFSFQRAYGAGAETIAQSTGMPRSEVDALIAAEEKLYPGVVEFDKQLETTINSNRIPTSNKIFIEGVAFSQGEAHWDSPTGTRYIWREGETPEFMHKHGKYTGFSPTERKNYPVQGFGGEIVQTMLGRVFRYMLENDRFGGEVLLVNTVHDCVWLDGKNDKVEKVCKEVQGILEDVPNTFNTAYPDTLNIDVPFPCETEVGSDFFDMTVIH